jgi:hypothetical protein
MKSSTKNEPKSPRDVAYYRERYRNRVFSKIVSFVNEVAQKEQITQKDMAERMGKDPAQLSRLFSHPSNLTLDTISDILLAVDAEAEPPVITQFKDKAEPNYIHPLIARVLKVAEKRSDFSVTSDSAGGAKPLENRAKTAFGFEIAAE